MPKAEKKLEEAPASRKFSGRFKKGQSGNPSGRPKDTLGAFLRDKKKLPEEIFAAVYPLLKNGDPQIVLRAAEFLRDTRDGKPAQAIELSGSDGAPALVLVRAGEVVKTP